MPDNKPEPAPRRNGLVMLAEPAPAEKPQSIREYMDSCPIKAGQGTMLELCEKHGISLDSPWPPQFPKEQGEQETTPAKPAQRQNPHVILPEDRLTADDLRRRMEEREAKQKPDSVEYQHSLLCALTLPRSRQPSREYRRDYQGRSLLVEAGKLWNGKDWIPQPLPYGPKARLALMHICSEAVKTQSRFIEIDGSARAFMDRIGLHDGGSQYRLFRQQMNALAACSFILGYTKPDGRAASVTAKPIEEFEAWLADDDGEPALWASELKLGEAFFLDLMQHAVPLSGNAIRGLSHSALALDYYGLFAYRLHALQKPVLVTWEQLREQIGQEYADTKDFKKKSLPMIKAVLEVYPSAKVEQVRGGLMLKPSYPPVARQSVGVSRGLADKVKATLPPAPPEQPLTLGRLHPRTIETFRKRYPRLDPYACEADFQHWLETKATEKPRSYDSAFLGFAAKWAKPNG